MSSTIVYNAIKADLQQLYDGIYPVIDFDAIEPALQQSTDSFLTLEELTSSEDMIGIGDLSVICLREQGAVVIHCFTPAPQSSSAARQIADTVRASLQYRNIGGIRITNTSPPDVQMMNNGLWTSGAISVSYEYDTHIPIP